VRRICEAGDIVDVVIITPEPGRAKEIGQKLLAMAESPRDVQWVTWPSAGYSIPLELFVAFSNDGEDDPATIEPGHIDADDEAPKRRRGRPRKQEETSTDDTTTSPEEE
jgi:hypothetical protein